MTSSGGTLRPRSVRELEFRIEQLEAKLKLLQLVSAETQVATEENEATITEVVSGGSSTRAGAASFHVDLAGVTANQHHAQQHGDADHTVAYEASGTVAAHTGDATDAHDASAISILDTANDFTADNVEDALAELQSDAEGHLAAENPHGAELDDLTDVNASTPTTNDVLQYQGGEWVNGTLPAVVGPAASLYLDPTAAAFADNKTLTTSPASAVETIVTAAVTSATSPSFLERYVSPPLGVTSIPAGVWEFDIYGKVSSVAGTNCKIAYRVNKRVDKSALAITLTSTGAGNSRSVTASSSIFTAGMANANRLLAGLIETSTQTAWITAFTSDTQVTAYFTDAGAANWSGTPLTAIYEWLFNTDTYAEGNNYLTTSVAGYNNSYASAEITGLGETDRLVLALFAVNDAVTSRTVSLYTGGNTNYSHFQPPLVLDHGNLQGLSDNDHPQYILKSLADAAGDILVADAADSFAKLTKGADGKVLTMTAGAVGWADAAGGSSLQPIVLSSAATFPSGDQTPVRYFTASTAGTITWATINGPVGSAAVVATFKKNGTDMWAASTKPQVPGGGGVSAERTPDGGSFHLAAGDYLTLNLTGGTAGPVVVVAGYTPD